MPRTVAVIIPAHNAGLFLGEALDSVLAQTRPPEQIIVVDDGSTDDTAEVARAWGAGSRVPIIVLQQRNCGISAARNAGIRVAQTDLVALLDADDLLLPDHLERLERGFDLIPELVLCFGDAEVFTASGMTRSSFLAGTRIETVPTERRGGDGLQLMTTSAFASLLWGSYIPTATTVFDRLAALDAGLYDERLQMAEDREFLLRLSRRGPFSYYPVVLARKREHRANHTRPDRKLDFSRDQFRVIHKLACAAHVLQLTEEERTAVHQALAHHAFVLQETASYWGFRTYVAACLFLARHGIVRTLFRAREFCRALAWPLLRQRGKKPPLLIYPLRTTRVAASTILSLESRAEAPKNGGEHRAVAP
jgi:glycosyltransferase involved in cell wall biosynthesis